MDEQKRNRLMAALTVNVILLIVILAAVVIYQIVGIALASARERQLRAELEQYKQLVEQRKDDLQYLESEQYLLELALKQGWTYENN